MKSAIVVGAGFAGLSSALHLARHGVRVTVFEAAHVAGGRAQELRSPDGRFRFDTGPTLITMIDVLREALGSEAYAELRMRRLEPGYSIFWPDGNRFNMHSDASLWLGEVARFQSGGMAKALKYLALVHEQLTESRKRILEVDFDLWSTIMLLLKPGKLRPWAFGNLRRFTERYFSSQRVVEAMTFQTLYLGLSPARAQAVYALLAVQEIVGGVWYAEGGTASIVRAFVRECTRLGVTFAFDTRVSQVIVEGARATGVVAGGTFYKTDGVVIAADREPSLALLGKHSSSARRIRYGHSAVVFYLGIDGPVDIPHHAVFLSQDPWKAYAALDAGTIPEDLMFYACNPPRSVGAETHSLMLLAPVPNRSALAEFDSDGVHDRMLLRLREHTADLVPRIRFRAVRRPKDFEAELGLQHGAAFGPAHDLAQMGPMRPSNAYSGARNVAFAGSGTRPGSGVPMVIVSGRLAASRLVEGNV